MKERILKLCKRLNKFSQADIETISGLDSAELTPILHELLIENIIEETNGFYSYIQKSKQKTKENSVPEIFQYYSKENVKLIIKCFCADIPTAKVSLIMNMSDNAVGSFYKHCRNILYKKQQKELISHFCQKPKIPSIHLFYNEKIYFYLYDFNLYIVDKELQIFEKVEKHTKNEIKIIHNYYCKLRRVFNNYAYTQSLAPIAYSKHWLQLKTQNEKLNELYNLLNINT